MLRHETDSRKKETYTQQDSGVGAV